MSAVMQTTPDQLQFYSTSEMWQKLGVTKSTWYRWRIEGKVPAPCAGTRYSSVQLMALANGPQHEKKEAT